MAVPSLSLSLQRNPLPFTIYILDLETLTTLITESTLGEQQRYQFAMYLSQEDLKRAWQVWHATKSVAGFSILSKGIHAYMLKMI